MRITHHPAIALITCALVASLWSTVGLAMETSTEVALWLESNRAVATSPLSGRRDIPLDAKETVVASGTSGINGIVVTSRRLLGFSSRTFTWTTQVLDLHEKVLERKMLSAFSVIRTDRHLYGFRGVNGVWFKEALGVRETVSRFYSNDYGVVFITNERVIGFTPLLGSFASKALDIHEDLVGVENKDGLILVSTTRRTLVLGSRLSGWEEFE